MTSKRYFEEKVVLITGASSGIGRASALALSQLNAKVVLASRNETRLITLRDEIRFKGGQAFVVKTDVCASCDTDRLIAETIKEWGRIDILIACAGKYVQDNTHEIDIESYKQSLELNFFGTLNVIKCVLPVMKRQKSGHIVIVNSLDAKKGIVGDGPYVSAKATLDGFGDVLRQEMKIYNIKTTSIYPGRVDTPMIENIKVPWISRKIHPDKVAKAIINGIKRNKSIIIVPSAYYLIGVINYLMPRFSDWFYRIFRIEGELVDSKIE
jgi:NADP-dependent 3-hydroxy acid dehydrogenase YdfG